MLDLPKDPSNQEGRVSVYRLPGLSNRAASVVVKMAEDAFPDWHRPRGRPKAVDLVDALRLALTHLRRNTTYEELGQDNTLAASTAWSYVQTMTAFLADALGVDAAWLAVMVRDKVCLVDGTLVTVFNWRHRSDLYSGKHRRYGMNLQVVVDLHGRLVGMSRPLPGSWHDVHCLVESGLMPALSGSGGWIGDAGYQGRAGISPIKKKPGVDRAAPDREFNTALAKLRAPGEWANAHLKNWRILATRYRGDLRRLDNVTAAVCGLQILNEQFSERRLSFDRVHSVLISE
jgi:hypothetical protein